MKIRGLGRDIWLEKGNYYLMNRDTFSILRIARILY